MARPKKKGKKAEETRRLLGRVWKALEGNDLEKADALVDQVLALNPTNAMGWYARSLIRTLQGKFREAYEAAHQSLKYNPHLVEGWVALAQAADALGYSLEAEEAMQRAVKLARKQRYDKDIVAGFEVMVRDLAQSVKRLSEDFRIPVEDEEGRERLRRAFALYEAGVRALEEEDVDKAVDNLRQLVDIAPSFPRGWGNLGLAYLLQERWDEAERALKRALDIDPNYEPAKVNLKALEKARGSRRKWRALLHKATSLKSGAPRRKELR